MGMTDPDFDDIARLWQHESDPAEREMVLKLARKAKRQARLQAYGDISWSVLIVAIVVLTTLAKPNMFSVAIGLLTLAVIFWLNWKRRQLRLHLMNANDRAAFLASSIRVAKHSLHRVLLSLAIFPPAILLAILLRVTRDGDGGFDHLLQAGSAWALSPRGFIAVSALIGGIIWLARSRLRYRTEIRRLEELQSAYAREARQDEAEAR
jgi:hypothetical protein